ncbi:polysaccharide deacetylase family protein [Colwellia sp. MB3u-4]|uniref:polysaccharide deacetylase family protein n=1 Tax=Colwellia sp. MB3u-4 TaxID=2759822 RepID=UPI0015F3D648|nr:polysaccharide deacetylase family protein [Colwellia sp. MB3u-4]
MYPSLPALNKLNLKATFYLILNSSTVEDHITDRRKTAQQSHKLASHSINHTCRGSLPNRAWVPEYNDLDKKYFAEIIKKCPQPTHF